MAFQSSTGTTGLDSEDSQQDSRLQSRYLRPISPGDDLTPDNFNVDDFLSSPNQSERQPMFDPGNRLEASGFNANDVSFVWRSLLRSGNELPCKKTGLWGFRPGLTQTCLYNQRRKLDS